MKCISCAKLLSSGSGNSFGITLIPLWHPIGLRYKTLTVNPGAPLVCNIDKRNRQIQRITQHMYKTE